ncbi:hypothetical protein MRB53_037782 [Persea americana]|nr:hypothetical protein MRB53_037782 [Persea americana]
MSDDKDISSGRARRSSFAGDTFANLSAHAAHQCRRPATVVVHQDQDPGSIAAAAAEAQRRRLSLTTVGLQNANNQGSPFSGLRGRNDSLASGSSIDECAVEEDGALKDMTPSSSFGRRVSFGARAMMDIRNSGSGQSGPPNGRSSPASANASSAGSGVARAASISGRQGRGPSLSWLDTPYPFLSSHPCLVSRLDQTIANVSIASGEGFNWSDNLRTRAERTSNAGLPGSIPPTTTHHEQRVLL